MGSRMRTINCEEVKHRAVKAVGYDVSQVMSAGLTQQEFDRMYFLEHQ